MEFLILIGIVVWIIKAYFDDQSSSNDYRNRNTTTRTPSQPSKARVSGDTYTPGSKVNSKIVFKDGGTKSATSNVTKKDIEGLQDAYSGESLSLAKGIVQCGSCKVFYHKSSLQVLNSENGGRCVSCGSVVGNTAYTGTTTSDGVNYDPNTVTLNNVRNYVGRVVTFEGRAVDVLQSKRKTDFAVMFENKSWTQGFKLVFFGGTIRACGGEAFIQGLQGKNIRVRGLVVKHERFGYEIIISERSMILGVS
jgi:hypothetical protein